MHNDLNIEKSHFLRFGVLCNGSVFQRWQADALNELRCHGHNLVLLIDDARKTPEISRFRRLLRKKRDTFLFTFSDNRFFKPAAKQDVDLHKDLVGIDTLSCLVSKKGFSEYFNEGDVSAIREYRLDFILRFGFNIIRGEILSAARFGIWSFHHDDEKIYRGGPPGFWEIYRGDPLNGAILQRLTDTLDGGIILQKGYLKTIMHSYRENLQQLLTVSSSWPARVADELSKDLSDSGYCGVPLAEAPGKDKVPLYKVPGNLQMLKFLILLLKNRILFTYRDLFTAEIWNVGIIDKPIHEVALGMEKFHERDFTWIPPVASSGYLADPSGFVEAGRLHILAEEYHYATQKAHISGIIAKNTPEGFRTMNFGKPAGVLDEGSHLSYPYVFKHNDVVYCVPESFRSSQITLYRRDPATGKFIRERTLLDHTKAVDPTLFFFDGTWWLFFTSREYSNSHLYLYHAPELTGEFKPHRFNPVKTDVRSARPAGTPFLHENVLYRPAQDCSVTYGGRIAINRVLSLTTDCFSEETIKYLEPVKGSLYDKGLHTISSVENYTLIDGKRYSFSRFSLKHQLRKKLTGKDSGHV
jgi:hypothetical protein